MKGPDIALMPLVLKVLFVNCISGENIASLRKALYKVGVVIRRLRTRWVWLLGG